MTDTALTDYLSQARALAISGLAKPGDWLTARQRHTVWEQVRDSATNELDLARLAAVSPLAVAAEHAAVEDLSAEAVEVVHRISSDPGRLTRGWADQAMEVLGEEVYTELVGISAIAMVLDRFAMATGQDLADPGLPEAGDPTRVRPEGVGDVGAWVSQQVDNQRANVSRTLTLVPNTDAIWRVLVDSHYSRGEEFFALEWTRALARPQVELVAARTTAVNQCFY